MFGVGFTFWQKTIGSMYPVGQFTTYNNVSSSRIIAINPNASIDTYFNSGSGADNTILSSIVETDRKIIIGGNFLTYSGSAINRIVRINQDGTRDTTFNVGTGFDSSVWTLCEQSDGKILAGGGFSTYSGSAINRLVRINSNGTRDLTMATTFAGNIYDMLVQTDGKIVVVGDITSVSGTIQNNVGRLNSNGTRDTTFNVGTGSNPATQTNGVAIQTDGKLLLAGEFTSFSGSATSYFVRLNISGSIDTTLVQGVGFNGGLTAISLQRDGKIVVGGYFSSYSGSAQNQITRLNSDGTRDTTFIIGSGLNSYPNKIHIEPTGKIIVGGNFTTYSGSIANRLVRINPDGTRDLTFSGSFTEALVNEIAIYPPL